MPQIADVWNLETFDMGLLTNSVQFGFILGTLSFVLLGFSDKYDPSKIIFTCCLLGALTNSVIILELESFGTIIFTRVLVGFSLAGIYPIGMKLIITWSKKSTSTNLSLLVGMLTLGTALPHLIRMLGVTFDWKVTILATSFLSIIGGILILTLGSGPYFKSTYQGLPLFKNLKSLFYNKDYISSAFGYFGHMWELYAFWACVPLLLLTIFNSPSIEQVAGFSFLVIGIGCIGCFLSGILSNKYNSPLIAALSLFISGLICLFYPLLPSSLIYLKLSFLIIWGIFVISDSPLYSSISAQATPDHLVGTALVTQNCIGFSISIISIFISTYLFPIIGEKIAWVLLPGPVVGLFYFYRLIGKNY